ncbi:hypothetical protein V8E51_003182 [Hyaloscypha variabilis]
MEELSGCWREAERADKTAEGLIRLRTILDLEFYDQISAVLREVETTSRLLRDLYDLFPIYRSRVPIIVYYLNVILPSLQRTLKEMKLYLEHENLPARTQWSLMSDRLNQQGGMTLAARFVMYVELLVQLVRLLSRSPLYDPTSLELLRLRHLRLRTLQHISAPPGPGQPHVAATRPSEAALERRHWAEKIFDEQPHSTTGLRHRRETQCFGPLMVESRLGIASGSKALFKLPFEKNRVSVTCFLTPDGPDMTRLLCRWIDRYNNPMYSCFGVQELCIRRKGSSLQFRRWSPARDHPALWLVLFFKTWEKMVLFHAAFGALKARCPMTINRTTDDLVLAGETKRFQGKILDDGYEHSLTVLQDRKCGGLRLYAAVRSGDLKKCPVWTAFVTHQSESPRWMERRSKHRIWLRDIHPYVFCDNYKKRHQFKRDGEFEIYFVNEEAATAFEEVFRGESETESIADHHDDDHEDHGD